MEDMDENKASRRVDIPKDNGTTRPLSIYCYEDKLVQEALKRILKAAPGNVSTSKEPSHHNRSGVPFVQYRSLLNLTVPVL